MAFKDEDCWSLYARLVPRVAPLSHFLCVVVALASNCWDIASQLHAASPRFARCKLRDVESSLRLPLATVPPLALHGAHRRRERSKRAARNAQSGRVPPTARRAVWRQSGPWRPLSRCVEEGPYLDVRDVPSLPHSADPLAAPRAWIPTRTKSAALNQ